jgi:hypothetical protein
MCTSRNSDGFRRHSSVMRKVDVAILAVAAALAGCTSHFAGSLVYMEPYKLDQLDCAELKKRASAAGAKRNEQEQLMDRASGTAAGSIIGNVVYGPDHSKALWEQRLYADQALRKGCDAPPPELPPPPPAQ